MAFRYRDSKGRFVSKRKYDAETRRRKTRKSRSRTPRKIKRETAKPRARYILGASYVGKNQRGGTKRTKAELHLLAPRNLTREQIEQGVLSYLETGRKPRGWKFQSTVEWNGKQYGKELFTALLNILSAGAETTVTQTSDTTLDDSEDEDREDS